MSVLNLKWEEWEFVLLKVTLGTNWDLFCGYFNGGNREFVQDHSQGKLSQLKDLNNLNLLN